MKKNPEVKNRVIILLNVIINGLVLWAASKLFPQAVKIDGFETLACVALLLAGVTVIIGRVLDVIECFGKLIVSKIKKKAVRVIIIIIISPVTVVLPIIVGIITIIILSKNLAGFDIIGFWFKLLLLIFMFLLQVSGQNKTTFIYGRIYTPEGQILVEGKVSSWQDHEDGQIQITIKGFTYLVPASLVILSDEDCIFSEW